MCSPVLIQPFNYLGVLLGVLVDITFFDIKYNLLTYVGVGLTSLGLFSKFFLLYFKTAKQK